MKVGDLVKHKWGTLHGEGLILEQLTSFEPRAYIMWNCHGNVTMQNVATKFLEILSENNKKEGASVKKSSQCGIIVL